MTEEEYKAKEERMFSLYGQLVRSGRKDKGYVEEIKQLMDEINTYEISKIKSVKKRNIKH